MLVQFENVIPLATMVATGAGSAFFLISNKQNAGRPADPARWRNVLARAPRPASMPARAVPQPSPARVYEGRY
jgi:hypothetical protein